MTIMISNASEVTLAQFMLGVATPGNQILRLYTNNVTPAAADTASSYTEMTTNGYNPITLNKGDWVGTPGSGTAAITQAAKTFTFTNAGGANTVYGYFVTDATTGLLLWAESFATAKVVQYTGDQIIITPTLSFGHA